MVLEYVRWWHPLTFSYFSQGINKLLTFKEQQFPDQERVGSRSPLPPEPTYGPIPEQGQPPRSSQHRKGHQPRQKQTRTMKGKGGSAPVSQHASPIREERNLLALYLKERKEKIDIALPGRSKCTFVTEVSREEITLNGLPVLLSPLQKGRSDSLIGEDLIKRPMASRIRSFI